MHALVLKEMTKNKHLTIEEVKKINGAVGQCFFSPDTMRFFKSRVVSGALINGKYFITSERLDENHPRLYTIRVFDRKTGHINTFGDFQQFSSIREAKKHISHIIMVF